MNLVVLLVAAFLSVLAMIALVHNGKGPPPPPVGPGIPAPRAPTKPEPLSERPTPLPGTVSRGRRRGVR